MMPTVVEAIRKQKVIVRASTTLRHEEEIYV